MIETGEIEHRAAEHSTYIDIMHRLDETFTGVNGTNANFPAGSLLPARIEKLRTDLQECMENLSANHKAPNSPSSLEKEFIEICSLAEIELGHELTFES